jgi:DNA polymerase III epsilon subunit-like protein
MSSATALDGRLLGTARAALWAGVRLVVIDLETCSPPQGGPHRVVAVAAVTCRAGAQRGAWSTLVDPECPIDSVTRGIHGITDDLVAGEPTFDVVAPQVAGLLAARDGERVVLVAHNVRSDVSVLRAEFARVGVELPTIEVLDTMGRLARHVEVRPADKSLTALADTLGIVNPRPHDALADAQTCADATLALLDRAAARGQDDFDQLLADVSRGATTTTIRPARRAGTGAEPDPSRTIDPDHIATHRDILDARVRQRGLAAWAEQVAECCQLRCPSLIERVEQAGPAPQRLLPVLEGVLDRLVADADGPGVATLLPAVLLLLEHLEPRKGRHGMRDAVLAWTETYAPKFEALDRCDDDRCPSCEARQPCPLDTWREALAPLAVGDLDKRARSFLRPNGKQAGTGAFTTWLTRGQDHQLADAALALVVEHWRATDQAGWADTVA